MNLKIKFSSGNWYQGEFKEGKYNGLGIFKWSDGRKYEGLFKNGKKHGHGKWISNNGEFFVGEWENGKKNGHGILNYKDGSLITRNDVFFSLCKIQLSNFSI